MTQLFNVYVPKRADYWYKIIFFIITPSFNVVEAEAAAECVLTLLTG